jgi:hypothetical protein
MCAGTRPVLCGARECPGGESFGCSFARSGIELNFEHGARFAIAIRAFLFLWRIMNALVSVNLRTESVAAREQGKLDGRRSYGT